MFARIIQTLLLASLTLTASSVFAQEPDPDMQEMRQKMQQIGMQVMQNMAQKGVDPQEFFGQVRQQMQEGTFDMAAFQKKMVDDGLIDKETVAQMQTTAQSATLNSIRRQLGVSEAEWIALQPKIQRVIIANGDADNSNPAGGVIAGFMRGQMPKSDVTKRKQELQSAIASSATTAADVQLKLAALRDARLKAKEELAAAQKDLVEVLTVRQEAALVLLGLL
jgi:hypothetical protein